MGNTDQNYAPARDLSPADIPGGVSTFFNGEDLLSKTQAAGLSTTDVDGWPRALLLTAGEMVMLPDGTVRFAIFRQSGTAANLARDGRMVLSMSLDGGICEVRMRATACSHKVPDGPLAYFKAEVESVRLHAVTYADVISGVTFAVHDPSAELLRWQQQIAALGAVS